MTSHMHMRAARHMDMQYMRLRVVAVLVPAHMSMWGLTRCDMGFLLVLSYIWASKSGTAQEHHGEHPARIAVGCATTRRRVHAGHLLLRVCSRLPSASLVHIRMVRSWSPRGIGDTPIHPEQVHGG